MLSSSSSSFHNRSVSIRQRNISTVDAHFLFNNNNRLFLFPSFFPNTQIINMLQSIRIIKIPAYIFHHPQSDIAHEIPPHYSKCVFIIAIWSKDFRRNEFSLSFSFDSFKNGRFPLCTNWRRYEMSFESHCLYVFAQIKTRYHIAREMEIIIKKLMNFFIIVKYIHFDLSQNVWTIPSLFYWR